MLICLYLIHSYYRSKYIAYYKMLKCLEYTYQIIVYSFIILTNDENKLDIEHNYR